MFKQLRALFVSRQFALYGLIGLSGVGLDLLVFFILHTALHVPAPLATAVAVSAGITNNFFLNRRYNFKLTDHTLKRFMSFYAIGAIGMLLSALFMILLHTIIGMSAEAAKVISVPFIVAFQFFFNRHMSFAKHPGHIPVKQLAVLLVAIAVVVITAFNGPHANFSDEHDNLLGGKLLTEGQVIYKDFFSHHMPLQYFIALPFYLLFGANLIATKVVFGLLLGIWILIISRHLYRRYGAKAWACFTLLLAITQILTWGNMFLAETFVAYSMLHVLVLFWTRTDRSFTFQIVLVYAVLAAVPALSSLAYVWLSLLAYILLLIHGWRWFFAAASVTTCLKRIAASACVVALPYILMLGYVGLNGALHEFKQQAFTFNTRYYSQFVSEVGSSPDKSLYLQAYAITQGLQKTALTAPAEPHHAYRFMFAWLFIGTIVLAALRKRWVGIAVLFGMFILFGAVRNGFVEAFLPGRSGTVITIIGLGGLSLYLFELRRVQIRNMMESVMTIAITSFFILTCIASSVLIVQTMYDYTQKGNWVVTSPTPSSPEVVINAVTSSQDHYWIGPLDFYSQMKIKAKNASLYTFYLPWHAACAECRDTLLYDLAIKRPKVIHWDNSGAIHGRPTAQYGKDVTDYVTRTYFQVSDERLKYFYFDPADKETINQRLAAAGYAL